MCSHMGFTASRLRGREQAVPYQAKAVIYNVAGQGSRQEPKPESGLHQKDLGQTESGPKAGNYQDQNQPEPRQKLGQNQGQNQIEPGQIGPFIMAGATRVDNEAATKPHPK